MSLESQVYEIRLKSDQFNSKLDQVEGRMNGFESKVGGIGSSFGNLGGTITNALAGGLVIGAATTLLSKLTSIGIESVRIAKEFTNMKDAISFSSGGDAVKNIEFLDSTIDRLGLNVDSTYKGFKTFQGALMGTALEGEKGREIFKSVSEAASVMKLSAEQTEGSFLALGQMISKGTVSSEELRGQLGERLPGAFQIFAKSLGVSTSKLGDMLKKGDVLAEDALPKFAAELKKTFSPGVAKAQVSFNANWNRLENMILRSKIALGDALMPAFNKFALAITNLNFDPLISALDSIYDSFASLGDLFDALSAPIKEIFSSLGIDLDSVFSKFDALDSVVTQVSMSIRLATLPVRILIEALTEMAMVGKGAGDLLIGTFKAIASAKNLNFGKASLELANGGKAFSDSINKADTRRKDFIKKEATEFQKILFPKKESTETKLDKSVATSPDSKLKAAASTSKNTEKSNRSNESGVGVEKVASSTRNTVINIAEQIGEVNFNKAGTWKETEAELLEKLRRLMLTMVNDVNVMAQ